MFDSGIQCGDLFAVFVYAAAIEIELVGIGRVFGLADELVDLFALPFRFLRDSFVECFYDFSQLLLIRDQVLGDGLDVGRNCLCHRQGPLFLELALVGRPWLSVRENFT